MEFVIRVVSRPARSSASATRFDDAIQAAIWARELNPSLFRMLRTWLSTVCSEMNRRAPISLLLRPSATSRATSASRFESRPRAAHVRSRHGDDGRGSPSASRTAASGSSRRPALNSASNLDAPSAAIADACGLAHQWREERHDLCAGPRADRCPRLPAAAPRAVPAPIRRHGSPARRAGRPAAPGRRSGGRSAAPRRTAASTRRRSPAIKAAVPRFSSQTLSV